MKRIIVVGDLSSTNLGDPLLTNCCCYIVNKVLGDCNVPIELFDIAGRKTENVSTSSTLSFSIPRKTSVWGFIKCEIIPILKWFLIDKKSFIKRLSQKDIDKVAFVIAGGALISSSIFYALRLHEIVRVAKKHRSKIIFNSVGIEKSIHNIGLSKYIIRNFLKQNNVVAFSTRDHIEDIPYLTNRNEFFKKTPDPGLFASETYNVKRKDSQIIGLSVISAQAYQSLEKDDKRAVKITSDYLISYWSAIINHLQKLNYEFRILTNGGKADYEMALKLVNALKLDERKYLLPLPQNPLELVSQMSMFRLVIAHRLHACIIASSLNIPVIPLIWSDKVKAFAEMIGNRFAIWPELNEVSHFDETITKSLNEHINVNSLKDEVLVYLYESIKYAAKE